MSGLSEAEGTHYRATLVYVLAGVLALVALSAFAWDDARRNREFDATAPIIETCVHHNVRQKVTVESR